MSDILERLQFQGVHYLDPIPAFIADPLCAEAAGEIKRLRLALRAIYDLRVDDCMGPHDMALRAVTIARETLATTDTSAVSTTTEAAVSVDSNR
jgi:hypothetical protein